MSTVKDSTFQGALQRLTLTALKKIRTTLLSDDPIVVRKWVVHESVSHTGVACGCLMMDGYLKDPKRRKAAYNRRSYSMGDLLAPFYRMGSNPCASEIISGVANKFDGWALGIRTKRVAETYYSDSYRVLSHKGRAEALVLVEAAIAQKHRKAAA